MRFSKQHEMQRKLKQSYRNVSPKTLPSTIKQIESKHGHLNDDTPRNNCFFGSLYLPIISLNSQISQFNRNMHKNYRKLQLDVIKRSKNPEISKQCEHYRTNIITCECGELTLYSNMFNLQIPCSLMYSLGIEFPLLEGIDFNFEKQFDELLFDLVEGQEPQINIENNIIKKIALRNIKKFSHSKQKEQIEEYFEKNYQPQYKEFVMGYLIELYDLISKGIEHFSPHK